MKNVNDFFIFQKTESCHRSERPENREKLESDLEFKLTKKNHELPGNFISNREIFRKESYFCDDKFIFFNNSFDFSF